MSQRITQPEAVMNAVLPLVEDGDRMTVSGYAEVQFSEANIQPKLKEILAGKTTYRLPMILRVYAR